MKIALLIDAWDPFIGGGQKLFWQLACGLVKDHRCQVEIITRALKSEEGKVYNKAESYYNGRLKLARLGKPLFLSNFFGRRLFPFQAAVYLLKSNFSLVCGSHCLPGFSLQIIKILKGIKIVFLAIGLNHFWQETNPGLSGKILQGLETFFTKTLKYDWVITDDYDFYKSYKRKNISFIPNGAEIKPLLKIKKWPDFTFLFVGRLDKRKGINYLLQAFKVAKENHFKIKLRVIGSGPEEKNYKHLNQELKLKDVKFVGRVSDKQLKMEYAKAHCFVLPSLWEGHPLVLFEAFSHKLPVISTNVGSLSCFINPKNGFLVLPKNKKDLSQAMIKAMENRNLAKMGESGYQMVKNNYSWKKTVNNYFDVFKKFLR